ncbi:MAG: rRNA ((1402)-2-O)-methyltransferase [Candidatus Parcubacteria bacterium]|jgi:16S rRNA (cytidine1402-2'-O)-methyltransferase
MKGKLYIVATPIGNAGDITLRAIETLKIVDVICAEDTRVTKKLLSMYKIEDKKVYAVNEFADAGKIKHVLDALDGGKDVAFSSDAGTPGISDPGALLVAEARKVGITIVPIPGVSAVATAMSVAGIRETPFTFYGFLPHKKGRQKILDTLLAQEHSIILYESPHRFLKLLAELQERVVAGVQLEVTVCRELTKMYEDIRVGAPAELIEYYTDHGDQVRGEFVLIIRKI